MRNWDSKIGDEVKMRVLWIATPLLDAVYLVLWVAIQWLVSRVIAHFHVSGPEQWMLLVFQWVLFPIITLAPVALYIVRDISIMVMRTKRAIIREHKKDVD
jgi:hypothetical protein